MVSRAKLGGQYPKSVVCVCVTSVFSCLRVNRFVIFCILGYADVQMIICHSGASWRGVPRLQSYGRLLCDVSRVFGTAVTKDLSAVGSPVRAWKSNSLVPQQAAEMYSLLLSRVVFR